MMKRIAFVKQCVQCSQLFQVKIDGLVNICPTCYPKVVVQDGKDIEINNNSNNNNNSTRNKRKVSELKSPQPEIEVAASNIMEISSNHENDDYTVYSILKILEARYQIVREFNVQYANGKSEWWTYQELKTSGQDIQDLLKEFENNLVDKDVSFLDPERIFQQNKKAKTALGNKKSTLEEKLEKIAEKYKNEFTFFKLHSNEDLEMVCINPDCKAHETMPIDGSNGWLLEEGWECDCKFSSKNKLKKQKSKVILEDDEMERKYDDVEQENKTKIRDDSDNDSIKTISPVKNSIATSQIKNNDSANVTPTKSNTTVEVKNNTEKTESPIKSIVPFNSSNNNANSTKSLVPIQNNTTPIKLTAPIEIEKKKSSAFNNTTIINSSVATFRIPVVNGSTPVFFNGPSPAFFQQFQCPSSNNRSSHSCKCYFNCGHIFNFDETSGNIFTHNEVRAIHTQSCHLNPANQTRFQNLGAGAFLPFNPPLIRPISAQPAYVS